MDHDSFNILIVGNRVKKDLTEMNPLKTEILILVHLIGIVAKEDQLMMTKYQMIDPEKVQDAQSKTTTNTKKEDHLTDVKMRMITENQKM